MLLITRRVNPEEIYRNIDWGLLVMFAGLFVVLAGVEKTSLEANLVRLTGSLHLSNVFVLSGVAAFCRTWSAMCRRCCCSSRSWRTWRIRGVPG